MLFLHVLILKILFILINRTNLLFNIEYKYYNLPILLLIALKNMIIACTACSINYTCIQTDLTTLPSIIPNSFNENTAYETVYDLCPIMIRNTTCMCPPQSQWLPIHILPGADTNILWVLIGQYVANKFFFLPLPTYSWVNTVTGLREEGLQGHQLLLWG